MTAASAVLAARAVWGAVLLTVPGRLLDLARPDGRAGPQVCTSLTGVAFAALRPRWRRVALIDTAVAAGFGAATALTSTIDERT